MKTPIQKSVSDLIAKTYFFVISGMYGRAKFWFFLSCFALFAITTLSRILFHGYIFRFDYHLYQPDGILYTYIALKWSGVGHSVATQQVIDWYIANAEDGAIYSPAFFDSSQNPIWTFVSSRILYPALSVPFVKMLGIPGMLVVPILAFATFFAAISILAWRLRNPIVALSILVLISVSPTVSRWYIVNYTDSLLAGLFALLLLLNWNAIERVPIKFTAAISILIILTSMTRFCLPYWYAIALVLLWRRKFHLAVLSSVLSSVAALPALLTLHNPDTLVDGSGKTLIAKLLYFPVSALRILFIEVAQLAAIDRSLLILLALAVVIALKNLGRVSSQLYLASIFAGWFIGALNGVLGVNLRYQLPIVAFACWVVMDSQSLKNAANRFFRSVFKVSREKAGQ